MKDSFDKARQLPSNASAENSSSDAACLSAPTYSISSGSPPSSSGQTNKSSSANTNNTLNNKSTAKARSPEQEKFLKKKEYGPKVITPPTNIGGFSALYNPKSGHDGSLLAYISTHANFKDSLTIDSSNRVTDNTGGDLGQAVTDIMKMQPRLRSAAVAQFRWTDKQKKEHRKKFKNRMDDSMRKWSTSSHGMKFFIDQPDWESIQSDLTCVALVNDTPSGIEHINTTIWKVPNNNSYTAGAFISTNNSNTGRGNTMSIDSTHTNMTSKSTFLREKVMFATGSSRLTRESKTLLRNLVMLFEDSNTNSVSNKIKLIGRASNSGPVDFNNRLAKKRMNAVKREIMKNVVGPLSKRKFPGFGEEKIETQNKGESGKGTQWQRVDIIIGSGEVQDTIMHELGHVFGLDDEYITDNSERVLRGGTGGVNGTRTGHDQRSHTAFNDSGAENSTYEMNDSIMSVGNEVRSQHMVTFNYALRTLTNNNNWKIKKSDS